MVQKEKDKIYKSLKVIIKRNGKEYDLREKVINSIAKVGKRGLHIYGKKKVSIAGRKPQQTYLAGVIEQKHFVSFYFMPIYSHTGEFSITNDELRKTLKGKSCFNIKLHSNKMVREIEELLKKGINIYKRERWI